MTRLKKDGTPAKKRGPKGPRKTLTDEQIIQVEGLAAVLNQDQLADYFGMTRKTFATIMTREPEILTRYKRGKASAIGTVANGLLKKARDGDTTSMIFYLKTQAGWRETVNSEVTVHQPEPFTGFEITRVEPNKN